LFFSPRWFHYLKHKKMSMFPTFVAEPVAVRKFLENKRTNVKMSTLKPLVPIVAITLQSNSATTIIPPFLMTILAVYVLSGLMRAIVIVANAVGLVQDVDKQGPARSGLGDL